MANPTPKEDQREAQRRERVERLLRGDLRKHLKRASEMAFDYQQATRIAAGATSQRGGRGEF